MSGFDMIVWHGDYAATPAQAVEFVKRATTDTVLVTLDAEVDAFVAELRRRYPVMWPAEKPPAPDEPAPAFLHSIDDPKPAHRLTASEIEEASRVTTVWNGDISRNGPVVQMSVFWERAITVVPDVEALAQRHGLTVLEEESTLKRPRTASAQPKPYPWPIHLTLRITGRPGALDEAVLLDDAPMQRARVASRREAHDQARAIALRIHAPGYRVDDPRCLAQAYELVRETPEQSGLPGPLPKGVEVYSYRLKPDVEKQTP